MRPVTELAVVLLLSVGEVMAAPPVSRAPLPGSPAEWTPAILPGIPVVLAANGNTLWVGGFGGMLARSDDAGASWTVMREPKGDSVILAMSFRGRFGAAVGLPKLALVTEDGGAHWRTTRPPFGADQVAIADGQDLAIADASTLAVMYRGRWRSVALQRPSPTGKDAKDPSFYFPKTWVRAIASLGNGHSYAAILPGGEAARSDDGGLSWSAVATTGVEPEALVASDGRFWLRGYTLATRMPAVISMRGDGAATTIPGRYSVAGCTEQGCILDDEPIVFNPWAGNPAGRAYRRFPPVEGAIQSWAIAENNICVVSGGLNCAPLENATAPAAVPAPTASGSSSELGRPECLVCPSPDYPAAERDERITGSAVLLVRISKSGDVELPRIVSAPGAGLAQAALAAVSRWRYKPATLNGAPISVEAVVTFQFEETP